MKITYHAWLRETLQVSEENLTLSQEKTLEEVLSFLKKRDSIWHETLEEQEKLRYAVNHVLCKDVSILLKNEDILSIFPPFTGG